MAEMLYKDMNWKEYRQQLLKDPAVRREYEALEPEYRLAVAMMKRRSRRQRISPRLRGG